MSDTLAATDHSSLSISWYVSEMLAAISLCLYGVCVRYAGCHRYLPLWRYVSDTLASTDHRSLSLWKYMSDMLTATGPCFYGGVCAIGVGGVIYVQVYKQKVNAVRAWGWTDGYTRLITLWWGW